MKFLYSFILFFIFNSFTHLYALPPPIEVTRDVHGIWKITGDSYTKLEDIYFHVGRLLAQDRLFQLEMYRRTATGTLSEVLGREYLNVDIRKRIQIYTQKELDVQFQKLTDESKSIITGYVKGINKIIQDVKLDKIKRPFEFIALGIYPEFWTVSDVLLWGAELQRNYDSSLYVSQISNLNTYQELKKKHPEKYRKMFADLYWWNDPDAITYIQANKKNFNKNLDPLLNLKVESDYPEMFNAATELKNLESERIQKLTEINAYAKLGSYAWAVNGKKSKSGNPMLFAGPEMGHPVPSPLVEGSIHAGPLQISGMLVPGAPGIVIGRTEQHAWSMQVGHAQTWDYYIENLQNIFFDRNEIIQIKGESPYVLPVYKSKHGPVVYPHKFDKKTHDPQSKEPLLTFKYAHLNYELNFTEFLFKTNTAQNKKDFAKAIELAAASQHVIYINKKGELAYWMTGRDPKRPAHYEPRFPQPMDHPVEWSSEDLRKRTYELNPKKNYFSGWNNKSHPHYFQTTHQYGVFHRANVIDSYLKSKDKLSYEDLKFLAQTIYTKSDQLWSEISLPLQKIIQNNKTQKRSEYLQFLNKWDGHSISGGPSQWVESQDLADEYIYFNTFINHLLTSIFKDELGYGCCSLQTNILLRYLKPTSNTQIHYSWIKNLQDTHAPQTLESNVLAAFDKTILQLDPEPRPWGKGKRAKISFHHPFLGILAEIPYGARSAYVQAVEFSKKGLSRCESIFAPGQSGKIEMNVDGTPIFNDHFFDLLDRYKKFEFKKCSVF